MSILEITTDKDQRELIGGTLELCEVMFEADFYMGGNTFYINRESLWTVYENSLETIEEWDKFNPILELPQVQEFIDEKVTSEEEGIAEMIAKKFKNRDLG